MGWLWFGGYFLVGLILGSFAARQHHAVNESEAATGFFWLLLFAWPALFIVWICIEGADLPFWKDGKIPTAIRLPWVWMTYSSKQRKTMGKK